MTELKSTVECHAIHQYATGNDKYMKDCNKKESLYINYKDVNNLCGWTMSQRLLAGGFTWFERFYRKLQ